MPTPVRVLVREHTRRLCAGQVASSTVPPLPVGRLWGKWHYRRRMLALSRQASDRVVAADALAPWYSNVVAHVAAGLLARVAAGQTVRVVQLGAASDAHASHFMNCMRDRWPSLHDRLTLTLVDVSDSTLERQRKHLAGGHARRCNFVQADLADVRTLPGERDAFTLFVAMDVLGALPHDKMVHVGTGWRQVELVGDAHPAVREELRPVTDPLLRTALQMQLPQTLALRAQAAPARASTLVYKLRSALDALDPFQPGGAQARVHQSSAVFVPTGAMQMLQAIARLAPRHALLASDVDAVPPPMLSSASHPPDGSLHAANAPSVCSLQAGTGHRIDHGTYLLPPGAADVHFPTDFATLRETYERLCCTDELAAAAVEECAHAKLFARSSFAAQARTRTGFNPLVAGFANTRWLLANNVGAPWWLLL